MSFGICVHHFEGAQLIHVRGWQAGSYFGPRRLKLLLGARCPKRGLIVDKYPVYAIVVPR